jgi:hypothetical protein
MSNYSTSQKIAIIGDIDADSRELWAMLNDHADDYDVEDIKQLYVDILSKDKDGFTRFDLKVAQIYIEAAMQFDSSTAKSEGGKLSNFDALSTCYRTTRKGGLHSFLFGANKK